MFFYVLLCFGARNFGGLFFPLFLCIFSLVSQIGTPAYYKFIMSCVLREPQLNSNPCCFQVHRDDEYCSSGFFAKCDCCFPTVADQRKHTGHIHKGGGHKTHKKKQDAGGCCFFFRSRCLGVAVRSPSVARTPLARGRPDVA
jgi:hypothetical protein